MLKLIKFFRDKNVSIWKKILFVFPFIYFVSPVTIIPYYFFPIAGLLDNILVLVGMSFYLRKMLADYQPGQNPDKGKGKGKGEEGDNVIYMNKDDYDIK